MKTRKGIFLVFSVLIAFNGLAQQKTIREEIQEIRERTRRQSEILNKPNQADSTRLEIQQILQDIQQKIQHENLDSIPDSIISPINPDIPVQPDTIVQKDIAVQPDTSIQPDVQVQPEVQEKKTEQVFSKSNIWSLEECIQYAIDHNINIKQLQLRQEEAEIQRSTAKNSRLPNLNASLGNEWSFGKTQDLMGDFNDRNQMHTGFKAQSIIPIFTGFRIPNQISRTKLDFQAATQNLEKAKEDLSLNITSIFLQVLFIRELYYINEKQLELSNTQVERTKLLIEAGNIPKSQLYDIEAQVAKDEVSLVDAQNNLDLAFLDLAQNLELERNTDFDIFVPNIEGDVIAMFMNSLQSPDIIYENALNIKPVIKGQEYLVESSKKALKIVEAGYYPQLDFSLGIGTNYYHVYKPSEEINVITHEPIVLNPSFSDQIRNYGTRLIGLNMSIPVFNRYQVRNQVRSARIDILNQQLILENNKKNLYKEIQTAHKNALAALEKYRASERAVKSTSTSFEYVRKRYELGNATVFEFNESRTRLIQSRSEQAQAKYEYILRTKILDFYNGRPIKL